MTSGLAQWLVACFECWFDGRGSWRMCSGWMDINVHDWPMAKDQIRAFTDLNKRPALTCFPHQISASARIHHWWTEPLSFCLRFLFILLFQCEKENRLTSVSLEKYSSKITDEMFIFIFYWNICLCTATSHLSWQLQMESEYVDACCLE